MQRYIKALVRSEIEASTSKFSIMASYISKTTSSQYDDVVEFLNLIAFDKVCEIESFTEAVSFRSLAEMLENAYRKWRGTQTIDDFI